MFFSNHQLAFCFVFLCASHLSVVATAEFPSVKELSDGVDSRHATYRDLKFVYDVRYRTESSPTTPPELDTNGRFVSARDVFKFARSASSESPGKWNSSWVRTSNRGFGVLSMTNFAVTDGEIQYSFSRWHPGMIGAIRGQHDGKVLPRSYGGNPFYIRAFENILFLRLNTVSTLEISPDLPRDEDVWNHLMDKLVVERERVIAGQTIYTLKGLLDAADEANWIEIEVSGAPDFLIYRAEIFHQKQSHVVYRVDQYSKVGTIAYPAKGYFQQKPLGLIFDFTYEFNVTHVGPLSAEERKAWIPKWPPNTLVQNPTIQTPVGGRQFVTQRELPLASMSLNVRYAVFLLFGCLVALAVAMGLWFSWSTGSFELRLFILLIGLGVPSGMLAHYVDQELAAAFVNLMFTTAIIAIPIRTIFGTSLQYNSSGTLQTTSPQTRSRSRIGFREWSMLAAAVLITAVLTLNLEASRLERLVRVVYGVICVLVLGLLFHRLLDSRIAWAILMFLVTAAGLFLFLQVPLSSLMEIPYCGRDHFAWIMLHIGGFVAMATFAIALRLNNWRIGTDWSLPRSHRFSTREIGLWTASLAIFLAIIQYLTKSDLGG